MNCIEESEGQLNILLEVSSIREELSGESVNSSLSLFLGFTGGNLVNPLTSLTDPEVYSIPILLLIGWRGEPGVHDEPQHVKQGAITLAQLDTLGIPYAVLPDSLGAARSTLEAAAKTMLIAAARERAKPFPIVAPVTLQGPDLAATLWPRTTLVRRAPQAKPKRAGFDVGSVITRALTAAGLKK